MFYFVEGALKTNYVLIDYENVQPEAMAVLNQEHFKVLVFVGANQAKVTYEVAEALQQMGTYGYALKPRGLPAPREDPGKCGCHLVKGGMTQEASIQAPAGMSV